MFLQCLSRLENNRVSLGTAALFSSRRYCSRLSCALKLQHIPRAQPHFAFVSSIPYRYVQSAQLVWRLIAALDGVESLVDMVHRSWHSGSSLVLTKRTFTQATGQLCSYLLSTSFFSSSPLSNPHHRSQITHNPFSSHFPVAMGAFQSMFSRLWSKKEVRILILGLVRGISSAAVQREI